MAVSSLVHRLFLREKSLVTFGGQSRLLQLCHDSCDLQRPRPIFVNYHLIFVRTPAQVVKLLGRKTEKDKAAQSVRRHVYKTNHVIAV